MARQARTNYQCGRGDGTADGTDGTERTGTAGQRSGARQPATSNNQLSTHRPPPHPSHPQPSLGAGTATGKIPPLKRFLLRSKPSTDLFNPHPRLFFFLENPLPPSFKLSPSQIFFLYMSTAYTYWGECVDIKWFCIHVSGFDC